MTEARREYRADRLQDGYDGILVTHGTAEGADELADLWALGHDLPRDPHPADWTGPCAPNCPPGHRRPRRGTDYCPLAGHRRNQHMVDLSPDLCVAFHHANSRGTADAIRRVTAAGIPVLRITA